MRTTNHGRRGGFLAPAAAGVLLLLALAGCAAGTSGTPDAGAMPSASASSSVPASPPSAPSPPTAPSAAAPATAGQQLPVLGASAPVTLSIASIGVRTDLLHLGLRENGSLEVPQDTGSGAPASWYNGSPTPGERGPSVMLGHVNALGGNQGVFADLRKLTPGTEINVSRTDGSTAVFTVDRGALYSKNGFPTLEVYGNTPGAELRLITCDGYDPATGLFDDNYVIYAKLKA
ncbi:sortase domain-bontaining protein [Pseudarthrobacter sp. NBSH8]|uniref:sortase domain-containing protein n=1 Tax=Pseudarthrobacter sp. NBSH8 TaxID=2596911 RepID=UPI00162A6662|nr:sortase [Pseudarthrobacter sp. NBSH8]QNE15628.1 class F sortase [Pseudarthrobacter sp. NBSH8]